MRLQTTGELRDSDNLGTVPTYTLATFIYGAEAAFKKQRADKIVLQRMYLDVPKAGWYQYEGKQEVLPGDEGLALFKPGMPSEPIFDSGGVYAVVTNVCPLMFGSGNDW